MSQPAYQEFGPEAIPEVTDAGIRVRVLAGKYANSEASTPGVIVDPHTDLRYLDVHLEPGAEFRQPLESELRGFIYVYEGDAHLGARKLHAHSFNVLGAGDRVELGAGDAGARFILVAGRPIGEAIVQYGPFVMNSRDEIEQAMRDYRDGRLVRAGKTT